MLEQKWQNSLFATQKQENDWVYTPNQGALRCVPPAPLSRLAGCALAVVMIRTFTTIEDLNPDWTEGIKLLNELTVKAPIASILCNKEYRTVQEAQSPHSNSGYRGGVLFCLYLAGYSGGSTLF